MAEFVWELPKFVTSPPAQSAPVDELEIDHVAAAINRLPQQFRTKPKIVAIMTVFCTPMAALEQAFVDLLEKRSIDTAEDGSEQMNILSRIVGQDSTVDVTATTLRSLIRARTRANKSDGIGDQIYLICRLVLTDYANQTDVLAAATLKLIARNHGRAGFAIVVDQPDIPWDLATVLQESFIRVIAGTGIRGVLEFTVQVADGVYDDSVSRAFRLSDSTGSTPKPGGGFGSYSLLKTLSFTGVTVHTTSSPWDAVLVSKIDGTTITIHVNNNVGNTPTVTVHDDQTYNTGMSAFVADVGNVGVLVLSNGTSGPTVAQLETAILASSTLARFSRRDPTPAKILNTTGDSAGVIANATVGGVLNAAIE